MKVIKTILRCFEITSGLKINFAKNQFGAISKFDQWRRVAVEFLNCSMQSMPFSYLGIPIGTNPRHSAIWDPVIRKCETKLARWKQRYIYFGGRVTIINAVLTALPIYFFFIFQGT